MSLERARNNESSAVNRDLDCTLEAIAEVLSGDIEAFKRFSKIKWEVVENRYSPFMKHFNVVLHDSIKLKIDTSDYRTVVIFYSNGTGRFDYKTFLNDIFTKIENLPSRIREQKSDQFKIFNKFGMRTILPPSDLKINKIGFNDQGVEILDINSKAMKTHVISKVTAAIKGHFPLRLEYHVESFRAIADMDELQFARLIFY